jgi:hypothetical protein
MGRFFAYMMKKLNFFFLLVIFASCGISGNKDDKPEGGGESKTIIKIKTQDTLRPIFGYRFHIKGDFDGDGKKEMLVEHFVDSSNGKELNKFFEGIDYDSIVALTMKRNKYCYIASPQKAADSLFISGNAQLFGLCFLHNEGDLDGNGTDEISYVIDNADWSSMNTCHVMTFAKARWRELYAFTIHEWEIPAMPEASASYGLFGNDGIREYEKNDTLNHRLELELNAFSFIKKIKNGIIQTSEMKMEESENDSLAIGDQIKKIVHLKK